MKRRTVGKLAYRLFTLLVPSKVRVIGLLAVSELSLRRFIKPAPGHAIGD